MRRPMTTAAFKPNTEFSDLERRIQTLTSILRSMDRRYPHTTSDRSLVPAFLRHLVTLFTRGQKDDPDAKRVFAVTGNLAVVDVTGGPAYDELRTLVVTQNPFSASNLE